MATFRPTHEKHSDDWEKVTVNRIDELEPPLHTIQKDGEIDAKNSGKDEGSEDEESLLDLDIGVQQKKRRKINSGNRRQTSNKVIDIFQKNSLMGHDILKIDLKKREDPLDLFFSSMAASLKKLSMERQIRAKMQISQIVGQLELEEYASRPSSAVSSQSFYSSPNESCPCSSRNQDSL